VPGPPRRLAFDMFVSVKALRPMLLVLGMSFATGSIIAFVPLYGRSQGVANPGFFFTIYALVMLMSRPISGTLSDRMGRTAVAVPGMAVISTGLWLLMRRRLCRRVLLTTRKHDGRKNERRWLLMPPTSTQHQVTEKDED
jgi:hypothetical protein